MENYNRLFLLEDPVEGAHDDAVAALRDQIMKGDDITNPGDKVSKISLSQLNTYSGEVDIQALTNFKAVKVDSVTGNIYETNLAKLLIELQDVGGIEDARQEGLIEVDSIIRDMDLAVNPMKLDLDTSLKQSSAKFEFIADDLKEAEYSIPSGSDLSVDYPYVGEYSVPTSFNVTQQEPNGTRTKFPASIIVDGNEQFGFGEKRFIVTLNGVVQNEEDGSYLNGSFKGGQATYGFEFNTAPVVGDEVSFMFDDIIESRTALVHDMREEAIAYSGAVEAHHSQYDAAIKSDIAAWQGIVDSTTYSAETQDLEVAKKQVNDSKEDIKQASIEADIISALTGATEGFRTAEKTGSKISDLRSEIELNAFRIDAITSPLNSGSSSVTTLIAELNKEAAELLKLRNQLEDLRQDADAAKQDDGSGGAA